MKNMVAGAVGAQIVTKLVSAKDNYGGGSAGGSGGPADDEKEKEKDGDKSGDQEPATVVPAVPHAISKQGRNFSG